MSDTEEVEAAQATMHTMGKLRTNPSFVGEMLSKGQLAHLSTERKRQLGTLIGSGDFATAVAIVIEELNKPFVNHL